MVAMNDNGLRPVMRRPIPLTDNVTQLGDPSGLFFEVEWRVAESSTAPGLLAQARVSAWIGEIVVWSAESWDGLNFVEHAAAFWDRLADEDMDPFGLDVDPHLIERVARDRLGVEAALGREQDELLFDFLDAHDLRNYTLCGHQALYLLRDGKDMRLADARQTRRAPLRRTLETLVELGDAVCAKLDGCPHPRVGPVLDAWRTTVRTPAGRIRYRR